MRGFRVGEGKDEMIQLYYNLKNINLLKAKRSGEGSRGVLRKEFVMRRLEKQRQSVVSHTLIPAPKTDTRGS